MGSLPAVTSEGSASGLSLPSRSSTVCTAPGAKPAPPRQGGTCPSLRWPTLTRAPVKKIVHAVVRTNPLKNIRSMLQLNPYAAVQKKNAELTSAKNIRAKALKAAKATGKPAPANPMAKRAGKVKKAKK